LSEMALKHNNENIELLALAVGITLEAGGNLSEVLSKVAANMREKSRLEGQVKTLTAQGKLTGIIVGVLPFVMAGAIYFLDKDLMIPMFTTLRGAVLVFAALILELIGFSIIRRITNIEM